MAGTSTTSPEDAIPHSKVWTTLITNTAYLSGLLTLDASLKFTQSKYPLVALYTSTFPPEGLAALSRRGIPHQLIPYLVPKTSADFTHDPRFYDCWSKLTPFGLTQFSRVVQLDSDMLVRRNMDELMDLPLDDPSLGGRGPRVFAASHACVCNPLHKPHYPADWMPENCAFTTQHGDAVRAQTEGAPSTAGLSMPNGGLQVVNPSRQAYDLILEGLQDPKTLAYEFADQSMLGDVFHGRWVALPYVYNALKTMRQEKVHGVMWRDDEVKNVHYILSPKPWDESEEQKKAAGRDGSHQWWWDANDRRLKEERERGIDDGF